MKKFLIPLDDCQPGMKVAEPVHNELGVAIVGQGAILDEHVLKKLKMHGLDKIKIYSEKDIIIEASSLQAFRADYNQDVDEIKDILYDVAKGNNLDIKKVDHVADSIISRASEKIEIRRVDEYTYAHSMNVSLISMLISKWLKLPNQDIRSAIYAGILHDMGKSLIHENIINKPDKLTNEEFDEVRKHPVLGYRLIEHMSEITPNVRAGVLMHHERFDGTGYPVGIKGDQIPLIARIVAIADVYDAMTSKRVYKSNVCPFDVFDLMENQSIGSFDINIVNSFLKNIAFFYVGDMVVLSDGSKGVVVFINPLQVSKPIVKVDDKYIDLAIEKGISITGFV